MSVKNEVSAVLQSELMLMYLHLAHAFSLWAQQLVPPEKSARRLQQWSHSPRMARPP